LKESVKEIVKKKEKNTKEKALNSIKDQNLVMKEIEKKLSKELQETRINKDQSELLTEVSNILSHNGSLPETLAMQSMAQLNFVLQRLTKVSMEKIINEEQILREELPFGLTADAKRLSESISLLMKQVNESRKIRSSIYVDLKKIKIKKDNYENK
jgi:hypothetical protein